MFDVAKPRSRLALVFGMVLKTCSQTLQRRIATRLNFTFCEGIAHFARVVGL